MEIISEETRNESSSLQLLIDVSSVVKELIENALDANATQIDISLIEGGCESIEVTDNGAGIREDDFELLATRNATSKISKFEDLNSRLTTFGFRGEALNSIATLSTLNIKTRTKESNHGWNLTFDNHGKLINKSKCVMNYGTIVTSSNLFSIFPVRRTQLLNSGGNKIKSTLEVVEQYALINPKVRITLTNKPENGKITSLFSSPGNHTSLLDVVSFLYGKKIIQYMRDWSYKCDEFEIGGIISDLYQIWTPTIQILYINGRPVTSQKSICNALINVYKHYYNKAKPSFILNLNLNLNEIDVNCSPDKRTIYITIEEFIITKIKIQLHEFFENYGINTKNIVINDLSQPNEDVDVVNVEDVKDSKGVEYDTRFNLKRYSDLSIEPPLKEVKSEGVFGFISPKRDYDLSHKNYVVELVLNLDLTKFKLVDEVVEGVVEEGVDDSFLDDNNQNSQSDPKRIDKSTFRLMEICGQFNRGFIIAKLETSIDELFRYSLFILDQHAADEKAKFEMLNKTININCQKLIKPAFIRVPPSHLAVALDNEGILECNGFNIVGSNESGVFVSTFPMVFSHVLGEGDFLEFLEKISSANLVSENETNVTMEYMWEYFQSIPRPPRIWSILATRACKSAIKIGEDLDKRKMEHIKNTLSSLDHPWNCPHGRPTIKCLATSTELSSLAQNIPCQLDFN